MKSYLEKALSNPKNFNIEIHQMDSYDHEEWNPWNRVFIHPNHPKDHKDFEVVDNPEDAADLIDTFEEKNPEGINDKRF